VPPIKAAAVVGETVSLNLNPQDEMQPTLLPGDWALERGSLYHQLFAEFFEIGFSEIEMVESAEHFSVTTNV
jgi:hypothetical protein